MNEYSIRDDYQARPEPEYAHDDDESGFQPHVYTLAQSLACVIGAQTLIDIGCGAASKLAACWPALAIVGLDYGTNLSRAAVRYPFGTWLECDLERLDPAVLQRVCSVDLRRSVLICADVIEHLIDPTALLTALKDWLALAPLALLSTPERVLCWGAEHVGPPPNPTHVREWTRVELVDYLTKSGLQVVFSGFTQTHLAHPETGAHQGCQTTLVILEGGHS